MIVIAVDRTTEAVRGELTRWFLELKPGVFVGQVSARIRDLLWERICEDKIETGAVMAYSAATEQGFQMRIAGHPKRTVIDLEGVQLIRVENDSALPDNENNRLQSSDPDAAVGNDE